MRLIDAEHLERRLRELGWFEPDEFDREIKLKCILDQEPIAYDVDKVVEQLAAESERWKESGEAYEDQKELGVAEGFKRAIEIVKSGGILKG